MGKLFGGGSTPKPTPVQRMPEQDDPAVKEAERQRQLAIRQRSGRASTVLSRANQTGGGTGSGTGAYGNSLLGQAN